MADPITLFVRAQDPSCDAAKKYLDEKNVEYTLRDVDSDPNATSTLVGKLGRVAVPAFLIGDRLIVGFDPMQLLRFLPASEEASERVIFGASVRTVPAHIIRERGIPAPSGVEVGDVREGTPAANAGIQTGDVILTIGSYALTGGSEQFRAAIGARKPGDSMTLNVWREDEITVEVSFPAAADTSNQ